MAGFNVKLELANRQLVTCPYPDSGLGLSGAKLKKKLGEDSLLYISSEEERNRKTWGFCRPPREERRSLAFRRGAHPSIGSPN